MGLSNLAKLYHVQGRYAEAEPLLRRVLAIRERALGPDHPDTTDIRKSYAVLLKTIERTAEADSSAHLRSISKPKYSKLGRNAPCPCGSGKKYKRCHGQQQEDL
jgi:Tetratricopeptide repeat/SEC-C motif